MSITVYHGGTQSVIAPLCNAGRERLDFGQGFYVTALKEQATRWARYIAQRRNAEAWISLYTLDKEAYMSEGRCRVFEAYDREWLDFIAQNRLGTIPIGAYDYVEGGIADDRVIDTVNLYIGGLMSAEVALERLARHRPNNQICLLNQSLLQKHLTYVSSERLG